MIHHLYPKPLQSLQTEIENHEPRIHNLIDTGETLISEGHPQSEEFKGLIIDLLDRWANLKDAVEKRKERLQLSDTAQQVKTRSTWNVLVSNFSKIKENGFIGLLFCS